MSWIKRLFRRGDNHEQWLEKNPGKASMGMSTPSTSADEQQRMRDQMEGELDDQRTKRDSE